MIALAVGHHAAILKPQPQVRWRFAGGEIAPSGLFQMIPMFTLGVATARTSAWFLAPAAAAFFASLWWYGRVWDRTR